MRAWVLAAVVSMTVAGGGAIASADPTSPGPTTTATPAEQPPAAGVTVFADNPDIVHSKPVQFETWNRTEDDRAVTLHFTTGSPSCYGAHATVNETATTVEVTLQVGTPPEAVERMCPMIAVPATLDVPLQAPLGARQVLSVY